MSRAIHVEGVLFLSATEAGKRFGFTNDYISRLAREDKITGRRIANQWFVDPDSLRRFKYRGDEKKMARKQELRALRKQERASAAVIRESNPQRITAPQILSSSPRVLDRGRITALAQSGCIVGAGTVLGALMFLTAHDVPFQQPSLVSMNFMKRIAYSLYHADVPAEDMSAASVVSTGETTTFSSERTRRSNDSEGVVVLDGPSTETEESVREYFSDEVSVSQDPDGQSGIIEPVFKSGAEERYRFLLVPVKPDE